MKTKEELNALKGEVEELNKKLAELGEEELKQVTGGVIPVIFASAAQGVTGPGVEYNSCNNNWGSDKLPSEPGSYKIGIDLDINEEWIPAAEKK